MKCLLPLLILINSLSIQGVLEWTVVGKVKEYGQNVTLFCNVSNCCPRYAGWDRWTPVQQTLFIDVKTKRPNAKYDGKVLNNGYTLIIQNLTKKDLNISYSCVYGATIGERKFLLEEDVFTYMNTTQPNFPSGNSVLTTGIIAALITVSILIAIVPVSIFTWIQRKKNEERTYDLELTEKLVKPKKKRKDDVEKHIRDTDDNLDLKEKILKIETEQKECIPINIRDQIQKQLEDWKKKDEMFVSSRASDYVMECLQGNSCLTLTAPSGAGKSFIARHTALVLQKEGYKIIPVIQPDDIRNYYQPGEKTVFIVDDICGNFTANKQQIENWKQMLPVIDTIITDKCCKIIVSCRLQVYKDDKFNILVPFKSCECNLISDKLCLTSVEKNIIAKKYFDSSLVNIDNLSQTSEFFPLLCSLYDERKHGDIEEFFKNPFIVYQNELDNLSRYGDEGNPKICSLAILVLFNNQLKEKWFQGRITNEQKHIIADTCEACEFNSRPKAKLQKELDTLDGTFVCKLNGIYRTIHDKLFDFLAFYVGKKMIECLIDHGDSDLVHERFSRHQSSEDPKYNIDLIIEIPDEYLELYFKRFIKDWSAGKVTVVFCNHNMQVSSFRQAFLEHLKQLDKSIQVTLANTKDTVILKDMCDSGNTPLILTCYFGYTDLVQWMLDNDVEVDQCRDDSATGLLAASERGHTDIVKLLLEKNANVDLCGCFGCSSLIQASQNGYTDIVRLLLEKNPKIDVCNIIGCSPLIQASQEGHTEIVKLLLERNPDFDICDNSTLITSYANNQTSPRVVQTPMKHEQDVNAQTYDGSSALHFSAFNGNLEITHLLLENNADCNICTDSKQLKTYAIEEHPAFTLEQEIKKCFDNLIENASSRVKDYVSKKAIDYVFDMEADSSPLHIACFMGKKDVVCCLLDYNAYINIKKEDGITPLFYACEVGHEDIVRVLLDKGADTHICRLDGKSPLGIATDNGHTSIVFIVAEHTKKVEQLPV